MSFLRYSLNILLTRKIRSLYRRCYLSGFNYWYSYGFGSGDIWAAPNTQHSVVLFVYHCTCFKDCHEADLEMMAWSRCSITQHKFGSICHQLQYAINIHSEEMFLYILNHLLQGTFWNATRKDVLSEFIGSYFQHTSISTQLAVVQFLCSNEQVGGMIIKTTDLNSVWCIQVTNPDICIN